MPALSPQSIIDGHKGDRTPIPLIVGLVVSGVCMLLALAFYLLQGGPVNVAIGALLALPTAIVLVGLLLLVDRLEPEPRVNLLLAFGWGAGVAILGALIINTVGEAIMTAAFGGGLAEGLTVSVLAPVVEESVKGSLLLYLLWVRENEIDGPTDGIVYAGMCGVGFALVENILYYMRGLADPTSSIVGTVIIRGMVAPLGHPLYTAITGLGVAYAATHRGRRALAIVGGWCGAAFLHSLWNGGLTLFGVPGMVGAYTIQAGVLITLVVVLIVDRKQLVGQIQRYLPAYIPSGLVQRYDIEMLGSMAGRKQARRWARAQAGPTGARAMGDYQLAATELALLHARTEQATISPQEFHGRRQAILALMRTARDAFFRRVPRAAPPPPPWAAGRAQQSGFFVMPKQLNNETLPVYPRRPAGPPPGGRPAGGNPAGGRPVGSPPGGNPAGARPPGNPPAGNPPGGRPPGPPPGGQPPRPPHPPQGGPWRR
ncbi:PrsW family intramembrane metalloprotease [Saccharopolyspora rosea]|uniref:PrsW family intramembrane metalloprotease n=1 Tax=Saccharopolyspora rosea TaxID=524884 RepID=A0ABW3FVF5_9PSEU|nr:PrsW family intramembrane metalloprotease [Saccharopolyspora rosea]